MEEAQEHVARGLLSTRGLEFVKEPGFSKVLDMISDDWDETSNPGGLVSLGVAENRLMHEELIAFANTNMSLSPHSLTYGDSCFGSNALRRTLASFLTTYLKSREHIDPDHIVCIAGMTIAVEAAAMMLADPGDGLLLGRPYYPSFIPDVGIRAGVKIVPAGFGETDPFSVEAVRKYEEALLEAREKGVKVKGLILCSPHNPLGRCYPHETLVELMKLCQKHQIHLLSDEIYALSMWHNPEARDAVGFTSVLEINTEGLLDRDLLHVFWGLSKDFGANGLRLACIITQNKPFLAALKSNSLYTYPPSPTDSLTCRLLSPTNTPFLASFLHTNSARLSAAYSSSTSFLLQHNIPYYPGANAALFLWIDLRTPFLTNHPDWLPSGGEDGGVLSEKKSLSEESDKEIDDEIQRRLMAKRVFLGKGRSYGAEEGGWWRVVFSHPERYRGEGLRRIVRAIG